MKRIGFVSRIVAALAAPLVPIAARTPQLDENAFGTLGPEYAVVSEETQAVGGVWLRFRFSDGSTWPGVFHAMNTTEDRLEDLRPLGIDTVEWWKGGQQVATQSLDSAIKSWESHIITGDVRMPDGGATFMVPR